jgi:hypothetical protein
MGNVQSKPTGTQLAWIFALSMACGVGLAALPDILDILASLPPLAIIYAERAIWWLIQQAGFATAVSTCPWWLTQPAKGALEAVASGWALSKWFAISWSTLRLVHRHTKPRVLKTIRQPWFGLAFDGVTHDLILVLAGVAMAWMHWGEHRMVVTKCIFLGLNIASVAQIFGHIGLAVICMLARWFQKKGPKAWALLNDTDAAYEEELQARLEPLSFFMDKKIRKAGLRMDIANARMVEAEDKITWADKRAADAKDMVSWALRKAEEAETVMQKGKAHMTKALQLTADATKKTLEAQRKIDEAHKNNSWAQKLAADAHGQTVEAGKRVAEADCKVQMIESDRIGHINTLRQQNQWITRNWHTAYERLKSAYHAEVRKNAAIKSQSQSQAGPSSKTSGEAQQAPSTTAPSSSYPAPVTFTADWADSRRSVKPQPLPKELEDAIFRDATAEIAKIKATNTQKGPSVRWKGAESKAELQAEMNLQTKQEPKAADSSKSATEAESADAFETIEAEDSETSEAETFETIYESDINDEADGPVQEPWEMI